jgi:hypothetical protein
MGRKNVQSQSNFVSGWSPDLKEGDGASFSYSRGMDFRKSPSKMTVLPKTVKETGTTVTDLITEMIQLPSGKMVAIDASGGVYTRTTGGVWAKNGTTLPSTAYGMTYNMQQDTIIIPGATSVHSISNADSRFGGAFTVNANAITNLIDKSATSSANIYTTTGSISESAVDKLSITPTIEPLYSIKVWITTKGTGDLIITMHDAANNTLGTVTIPNASLVNGQLNEFLFSAPVRMLASPNAATYHFHITHSGGTASTIGTSTASDFSTARYEEYAARLVPVTNGFHPSTQFLQYIMIANGRYVAAWEPISMSAPTALEFSQHRLTFPEGYEVTSMAVWNEYLAIACERRSTSATNEPQDGKIFFWDGISVSYSFFIDIPEGSPYALFTFKNTLHYFAGGAWWAWNQGNPTKLFQMPNTDFEYTDTNTYMVNYPHTMTVRNNILVGAFPSETNSVNIEHGVYSFGQANRKYPDSFGFSYTISTGTRTNGTLRIGMVRNFGDKLFISWRDGSSYGVDKVDPNSDPFSSASWESLIDDRGASGGKLMARADKQKLADRMTVTFAALPSGATVTPKYKLDRASNWTSGTAAVAGDTEVVLPINARYREIQIGFDLTCSLVTPEILSVAKTVDYLVEEED